MSADTFVNSQVTDAVAQVGVKVLGDAPAEAVGILYQQMAHAVGLALQNVISQQQHMYTINNAVTIAASKQMLATDPAAAAKASQELLGNSAVPESLAALQEIVSKMK